MYDFAIIGSGYAGAVMAARLAKVGRVVVLERGRHWRPGTFPETLRAFSKTYISKRQPTGLWGMRFGKGTAIGYASALGGSSPVNYGITVEPDRHVFDSWPVSFDELAPYFTKALEVLKPTPNPRADTLLDKGFLDRAEPGRRVDLVNTIDWDECTDCGKCVPGCNVGAKRSLDKTYLALAIAQGAEIRTETEVCDLRYLDLDGAWDVHWHPTGDRKRRETLRAKTVIVAAGTLGTLSLLSKMSRHIPLAPTFGQQMSLNGDGVAFLYDTDIELSGHSGAPISTSARRIFVDSKGERRTLMIMSGRIPQLAMHPAAMLLAALNPLVRDRSVARHRAFLGRRVRDIASIGQHGSLTRSFMFKLDGQDSAAGVARFRNGVATVDWPDYKDDALFQYAGEVLREWSGRFGGSVVPNIATLPGVPGVSVHPLGGCAMSKNPQTGVVNEHGQPFKPGGGVYPGLRIVDGSIMPGAIGVPPSLTITAMAELFAEHIAHEDRR